MAKVEIHGTTAPGFESVADLYAREMRTMLEDNTQLCIYHKGEKVVDLWATPGGNPDFGPDSLVNIFSSGKSLESIALGSLVSRGLMRFEDGDDLFFAVTLALHVETSLGSIAWEISH